MFWKRRKSPRNEHTLWLVKDDPTNEWWCRCPQGLVDAPWHDRETFPTGGSGWLFTCLKCSKAFMFARATRVRRTLQSMAEQATPRVRRVLDPTTGEVIERMLLATPFDWLGVAQPIQSSLVEGERYVYFDGRILPAVHGAVKFQGLWREHDLPDLPHIAESSISEVLDDPDYWSPESD